MRAMGGIARFPPARNSLASWREVRDEVEAGVARGIGGLAKIHPGLWKFQEQSRMLSMTEAMAREEVKASEAAYAKSAEPFKVL